MVGIFSRTDSSVNREGSGGGRNVKEKSMSQKKGCLKQPQI